MRKFVLLMLILSSLPLVAQNISGIVVNEENKPLIGLSVNNLLDTKYIPHLSLLK